MKKITYVLKKGFQYYPPCLTQVLMLDDLGVNVELYNGRNSEYIKTLFHHRNMRSHSFKLDKQSKNSIQRVLNFLSLSREIKNEQKNFKSDNVLWVGNVETAMAMNFGALKNHIKILNVLELYDQGSFYDKWLKKNLNKFDIIVCCEKHRAAIMQSWYHLDVRPLVIPNKSYDINKKMEIDQLFVVKTINKMKNHFNIIYQGIISKDRPLENIAKALRLINDDNIYFIVVGNCTEEYKRFLYNYYDRILFTGYIPAPQHLQITEFSHIGIANYDKSCLNNVFCAPNKIYEYGKYGIPCLASDNISLEETIGKYNAGLCINFNDINSIKDSIFKIREKYSFYSNGARRLYDMTDVQKSIKNIVEMLEEN